MLTGSIPLDGHHRKAAGWEPHSRGRTPGAKGGSAKLALAVTRVAAGGRPAAAREPHPGWLLLAVCWLLAACGWLRAAGCWLLGCWAGCWAAAGSGLLLDTSAAGCWPLVAG